MEYIKTSYYKYRNIILFNKNIFLAGIISAVVDIFIVNYASNLFGSNYLTIAGISLIGVFLVYNILFILLYFFDNRSQYINSDGSKKREKIKQDLKKLITVIGFAEISYLITKFFSTFIIFELFLENPALISVITTLLAWIIYITIANIMAKNQQLFN
jgi:hypothetical protein